MKNSHSVSRGLLLLATIICALNVYSVSAKETISKSYQVKAGFLLQFASYIEWAKRDSNFIDICLLGKEPFGRFIDEMVKARPFNRNGQTINIHRFNISNRLDECEIIFAHKRSVTTKQWRKLARKNQYLLISESKRLLKSGSSINLRDENNRVRLEVNLNNIDPSQIIISSELLRIAKVIKK